MVAVLRKQCAGVVILLRIISAMYAASAECLDDDKAMLLGCVKQMATYRFLYLTAFLSDAVRADRPLPF